MRRKIISLNNNIYFVCILFLSQYNNTAQVSQLTYFHESNSHCTLINSHLYLQRTKTQSSLPRYALLFFDTQTQTWATFMDSGIHIHYTRGFTLHQLSGKSQAQSQIDYHTIIDTSTRGHHSNQALNTGSSRTGQYYCVLSESLESCVGKLRPTML